MSWKAIEQLSGEIQHGAYWYNKKKIGKYFNIMTYISFYFQYMKIYKVDKLDLAVML